MSCASYTFRLRLVILACSIIGITLIRPVHGQPDPFTLLSVTGCPIQQGSATLGCVLPVTLTLTGDNFPSQPIVNISGVLCQVQYGGTSTTLRCSISISDRPLPLDTLLPITIFDSVNSILASSAPLVSFATPLPAPVLTSISGCTDQGSTTVACNTSTSTLTLHGRGFSNSSQYSLLFTSSLSTVTSRVVPLSVDNVNTARVNLSQFPSTKLSSTGVVTLTTLTNNLVSSPFLSFSFIPTASNSAPSPALPPTNLTITAITGCTTNANNITLGCIKPLILTLTGSGFPLAGLLVTVGGEYCGITTNSIRPTQLTCSILNRLTNTPTNTLLPVTLYDLFNQVQSNTLNGVQLVPFQIPIISSVSGCVGSGMSTTLCNPATDTITLVGSGFVGVGNTWSLVVPSVSLFVSGVYWLVIDSTTVTIPISEFTRQSSFNQLLAGSQNGTIPFYVAHSSTVSNFAFISFMPPTLNVTSISSSRCASVSPLQINECPPGPVFLYITGSGLIADAQVTVGGVACTDTHQSVNGIQCYMQAPDQFTPGVAYDLVISYAGNSFTLPSAIAFTAKPTINFITSQFCPRDYHDRGGYFDLRCAAGDVLTISGSFFSPSELLSVVLSLPSGLDGLPSVVQCTDVVLLSTTALTCQLPTLQANQSRMIGVWLTVQVYENATTVSNDLAGKIYRGSQDLALTGVSGCAGSDSATRGAYGCKTGDVITLSGEGFIAGSSSRRVQLYEPETEQIYDCQAMTVISSTTLTCVLPYITRFDDEVVLPIRVFNADYSNWLVAVGYSSSLQSTCDGLVSAGYRTAFVACLVLLVMVTVVLVGVLVWLVRQRWSSGMSKSVGTRSLDREEFSVGGKGSGVGVELL